MNYRKIFEKNIEEYNRLISGISDEDDILSINDIRNKNNQIFINDGLICLCFPELELYFSEITGYGWISIGNIENAIEIENKFIVRT